LKIFIGPVAVGNYYTQLALGLSEMGEDVTLFYRSENKYGAKRTGPVGIEKTLQFLASLRSNTPRKAYLRKPFFAILHEVFRAFVFLRFAITCKVFIFGFGRSFLSGGWDLWLLRMLGKKIFVVFNGSDIRPCFADAVIAGDKAPDIDALVKNDRRKLARLRRIEKYADAIVNWPPMSMFMSKRFLHGLRIGFLNVADEERGPRLQHNEVKESGAVRILHCPSNPWVKGTDEIRKFIQSLSRKYPIDWVEVTDASNEEVLDEIEKCDFVVDQLFSDTPMAGFALEAAWFGKPAVVGGYWADRLSEDLLEDQIPPVLYVHPDKVESAIKKLIADAAFRLRLGEQAQIFVRKKWNRKRVAENWQSIFRGQIPDEWWREPLNDYCHGCGVHETKIRDTVRGIVSHTGNVGLCMDHKPLLRDNILKFAGILKSGSS
jgi:glycosyltransferase involved in cell wall biosynthesis